MTNIHSFFIQEEVIEATTELHIAHGTAIQKRYVVVDQTQTGRIYKDLDTGELSPIVCDGKELEAWYLSRPIVQAIL